MPSQAWQVKQCSWRARGGCERTLLSASVKAVNADELGELLRCGLELYDCSGTITWWGYVHRITLRQDGITMQLSLDEMANRVRVAYGAHAAGLQGSGARATTAWADDLDSQAVYGVKELQLNLSVTSPAQAEALRNAELVKRSKPRFEPVFGNPGGSGIELELEGRGWWETLGWRYYSSAAGLSEYTTEGIGVNALGDAAANTKIAQQFTTSAGGWRVDEAWALVRKVGAPADDLLCELCANNAGVPGTVLATATARAGVSLSADYRWEKWAFGTPTTLSASSPYWLVFSRSGALSATDHYRFRVNEALGYTGGVCRLYGGAAWAARSPDAHLLFRAAGNMETTAQVGAMVSAGGQFLNGTRLDAVSGIFTNPFRFGDRTALTEIAAHLGAGNSSGVELLGMVTPERLLAISAKPAESATLYRVDAQGRLRSLVGSALPPNLGGQVVGQWAVHDAVWLGQGIGAALLSERVWIGAVQWGQRGLEIRTSPLD